MIRLTGILIGAALAIAAIVITLGLPELATTDEVPFEAPPVVAAATPAAVVTMPASEPQPEDGSDTDVNSVAPGDETMAANSITEDSTEAVAEIAADPVAPAPATNPSQNWYAFWSPFRSEIAAAGFITELQRTTGLDYRVVKLKPGVYEVAFAYSDPADRESKLDRITAATGLDMSGG